MKNKKEGWSILGSKVGVALLVLTALLCVNVSLANAADTLYVGDVGDNSVKSFNADTGGLSFPHPRAVTFWSRIRMPALPPLGISRFMVSGPVNSSGSSRTFRKMCHLRYPAGLSSRPQAMASPSISSTWPMRQQKLAQKGLRPRDVSGSIPPPGSLCAISRPLPTLLIRFIPTAC
jgi:hypothetical protein